MLRPRPLKVIVPLATAWTYLMLLISFTYGSLRLNVRPLCYMAGRRKLGVRKLMSMTRGAFGGMNGPPGLSSKLALPWKLKSRVCAFGPEKAPDSYMFGVDLAKRLMLLCSRSECLALKAQPKLRCGRMTILLLLAIEPLKLKVARVVVPNGGCLLMTVWLMWVLNRMPRPGAID